MFDDYGIVLGWGIVVMVITLALYSATRRSKKPNNTANH